LPSAPPDTKKSPFDAYRTQLTNRLWSCTTPEQSPQNHKNMS